MAPLSFIPADLAPGDAKSVDLDVAGLEVVRVTGRDDALFETAYALLWEQFGAAHEVESRKVLGQRLAWKGVPPRDGLAMRYDLLLLRDRGEFAAVRDHTAISDARGAVVHLSHLLVAPAWRRSGLAGWLRALPIQTARGCLAGAGFSAEAPVTLVAEMEYPDGKDAAREIRLSAYERAGFKKVDPVAVQYHQPDFRASANIDASGGPRPLPFQLIVRRVGRETEDAISGGEVRGIVERLYHMYARDLRPEEMAPMWRQLAGYPAAEARVGLRAPTT